MTAQPAKHSGIRQTHSGKKETPKFRHPLRRLPLSKSHVSRGGVKASPLSSNDDAQTDTTTPGSTSSILCNLRRSYACRGLPVVAEAVNHSSSFCHPLLQTVSPLDPSTLDADVKHAHSNSLPGKHVIVGFCPSLPSKNHVVDDNCALAPQCCGFFRVANARRSVSPLKLAPFPNSSASNDDGSDDDDDVTIASNCSDTDMTSCGVSSEEEKRSYRIRFQSHVKVVEIPHRHSYTVKQRRRMWSNHKEIRDNAKRNRIEYEWEGPDWQNVIEEDQYCVIGGEKVHPAHRDSNYRTRTFM